MVACPINIPRQLVAFPLGLGEDEDLGPVLAADLLQQPRQLLLLLVLVAHIHDLRTGSQGKLPNYNLGEKQPTSVRKDKTSIRRPNLQIQLKSTVISSISKGKGNKIVNQV